jgi:hypothetical protein
MGNFYTNYTLRGPSQHAVAAVLAGRNAIVTPIQDGCVVVFDEESEGQNTQIIEELAGRLSRRLQCPLLAVMNHDDDILWCQLFVEGELVDEYNSAPGYFETEDEEAAFTGPSGGDAEKWCRAFGVRGVAEVERILRRPQLEEGGYTFAVERHADLAAALSIPSFGVGAGFESICAGELPEDLDGGQLVRTKELTATEPVEEVPGKPLPGYYKVSFRAHPKLSASIPVGWMPNTWAELDCREDELTEAFRQAVAPHWEKFRGLGFSELGFKRSTRILNPNSRDLGGINFWNGSRTCFGQLFYNRSYVPTARLEKETIVISFTAVLPAEVFSCTNMADYLDPIPNHTVIRLKSDDAGLIHEQFIQQLKKRSGEPRQFPDLPSLQAWFDANNQEIYEYRVRHGAWVRMSDYEVERVQRKQE